MKLDNELINIIKIQNFSNFDDFLKYFYFYYDEKISAEKTQKVKNKYIEARKNILSYILANKQKIMAEIISRKNSK
jgi:hypothetical protein